MLYQDEVQVEPNNNMDWSVYDELRTYGEGAALMEMIACQCDDLPSHDHYMGQAPDENGVWGPVWDLDDIGSVWVDWKAVAKAFSEMLFWNGQ